MNSRLKLWQAKLKAAKAERHQWEKAVRQHIRAATRVEKQITELENKIAVKLAKTQQRTSTDV